MVGNFEVDLTLWPTPGAEPIHIEGESESQMILGARFLLSHSFTGPSRSQTEGYSIMGFDRKSKKYTLLSIDTNGTAMNFYEGVRPSEDGPIVLKDVYGVTQVTIKLNEDGSSETSLKILAGKPFQLFTSTATPVKVKDELEDGDEDEDG